MSSQPSTEAPAAAGDGQLPGGRGEDLDPAARGHWRIVVGEGSLAHRGVQLVVAVVILVAAVTAPSLGSFQMSLITNSLIVGLAVSGLNLLTGLTGQLSLGHSAFFGLGAYTSGILIAHDGWNPLFTLPVAFALNYFVGLLIGLPALRIRGFYLALVTLGVGVAFPELVSRWPSFTGGSQGLNMSNSQLRPPSWSGFGYFERADWMYYLTLVVAVVVLVPAHRLTRSGAGLGLRAIRDNEFAAAAVGVNLARYKTLAFATSAAITGLAGSLFAMYLTSLDPIDSFGIMLAISFVTALILGGIGTTFGPLLGGFAVIYIPNYTQNIGQGQVAGLIFGAILIVVIFMMPFGIAGAVGKLLSRLVVVRPPMRSKSPQQV